MIAVIQPSEISGIIQAPASKSSMQRACAAALLKKGTSIIKNPGYSNDDKAAMEIIKTLGAKIKIENGKLIIDSEGFPASLNPSERGTLESHISRENFNLSESSGISPSGDKGAVINCGESGLGIRMFTPIIALSDQEITITGEGSLLNRPMNFFDEFFPKLNVRIQSNRGKLPIKIKGPLQPKNIEVDGSMSSQFITGLLMAYSASLNPSEGETLKDSENSIVTIKVHNLKSKPYIDLTLDVMKQFGMNVPENKNYEEFVFHNDSSKISPLGGEGAYTVESDWSGAAFLLAAGAIAGPITVRGLDLTSSQADKKIIDALMSANAAIAMEAKGIKIRPATMKPFEFDATDCPDLFPPLVALAIFCDGTSKIKGVHRLASKESDRATALKTEFGKMGVTIELNNNDEMIVHGIPPFGGQGGLNGAKVHSHHDHRIAMACAVAALKADGKTEIEEAEAINKSYPDFFWHLKKLGADVSLPDKKFIV